MVCFVRIGDLLGCFLGLCLTYCTCYFLLGSMIVSFYWHQRRPNADWLTIPILIEYNKQRLHHEFAFSLCFLCFFWYTNKCRTRSSSALQRQFVTPPSRSLVFTFLSIFNWTQSLRPDHTHLRTYRDTSQLGLLLQIVCPPVCISRLHTYSISLFGYLLAMMKTDISRIRSNSIPSWLWA